MENEQSAGNLDHSDSNVEFSKLIEKNLHISDHMDKHVKPKTDIEFGYYLAGLIEGDGWFGDQRLEIAFAEEDIFLAYFIKKKIGYGSVLKLKGCASGAGTHTDVRYVLRHDEGLKIVLRLVNGKFLGDYKINQLLKHKYNSKFDIMIKPPTNFDLNSNHWLSGFSDAHGSFLIHLEKSKTHKLGLSLRFEFNIKQKNNEILTRVLEFFGGNLYFLESEQVFNYNSVSFEVARNVADYFDKFQLNSSKHIRYLKWRQAYRIVQRKEHFTIKGLNKIWKLHGNLRD